MNKQMKWCLAVASFARGCLFPSFSMEIQILQQLSDKDKVIYHRMVITRVTDSLLGHGIFPKDIIDVITGFEDSLLRKTIEFSFLSPDELNNEIKKYNDFSLLNRPDQIKFKKNNIEYTSGFYTKDRTVSPIDCLWNIQYHPNINNDYNFCALYRKKSSPYVALNDVYLFVHLLDYADNILDYSQYYGCLSIREEAKNKNYKFINHHLGVGQIIYEIISQDPSEFVFLPEDVICVLQRK